MQYICIYTDLINAALTNKAIIECDLMDVVEGSEVEGEYLLGFFKDRKLVFAIHSYRIVEAYCTDHVNIEAIEKKTLNNKRPSFKVLT